DPVPSAEGAVAEPAAGDLCWVPKALHAWVIEERGRDFSACVAGIHGFPEHDHLELCVRVGGEDVLSDPTGTDAAGGSGWRDEDDKCRLARRRVEHAPKLLDALQLRWSCGRVRAVAATACLPPQLAASDNRAAASAIV